MKAVLSDIWTKHPPLGAKHPPPGLLTIHSDHIQVELSLIMFEF